MVSREKPKKTNASTSVGRRPISESTIGPLSVYYRTLKELAAEGHEPVSSHGLANRENLSPAQVRKDLSSFGTFGTRGLGYPTHLLRQRIGQILGLDRQWNVGLVGAGHLGSALLSYKEFQTQGFLFQAVFDNDRAKIGRRVSDLTVTDVQKLGEVIRRQKLDMIVIAVPAPSAQTVCNLAVEGGIKAILNFSPVRLHAPAGVIIRTENVAMQLEFLSYQLSQGRR